MTRIGISGHQARPGIDWVWTGDKITKVLQQHAPVSQAFSCLAVGSDQVFALQALSLGIPVTAVIPLPSYASYFKDEDLAAYKALLARCEVVALPCNGDAQQAFLNAGIYVANNSEILIAVWDGRPAEGRGGTADIVDYCISQGLKVIYINPIDQTVCNFVPF